ncbi:MAG: STAS-like domain-containing protein [Romboutsia sp.]|uniref:STAS-like domain-containing protein n=1 Tax=Romboutsia sp. TaxID=1965302 RepID=UPI003F360593
MNRIKVNELCKMALSKRDGMILRDKIEEVLISQGNVFIDFEGITKYATPFFNICFAYLLLNRTPEVYDKMISVGNLTQLGEKSYNMAIENARKYYSLPEDEKVKTDSILDNPDI